MERSVPADSVPGGTTGARVLGLGSLAGLGSLLPVGADEAFVVGQLPATAGFALLSYQGPDGYPLRFSHLLIGGRDAVAAFRFDAALQRFRVYIAGAPPFVSDLTRLRNGDIVIVEVGPPLQTPLVTPTSAPSATPTLTPAATPRGTGTPNATSTATASVRRVPGPSSALVLGPDG